MQPVDHYVLEHGLISHHEMSEELAAQHWRVVELNSLEELEPLRSTWNRLASRTPGAMHFLSFDWFATYWRHNSADQKLRVIVVTTEKTGLSEHHSKPPLKSIKRQ